MPTSAGRVSGDRPDAERPDAARGVDLCLPGRHRRGTGAIVAGRARHRRRLLLRPLDGGLAEAERARPARAALRARARSTRARVREALPQPARRRARALRAGRRAQRQRPPPPAEQAGEGRRVPFLLRRRRRHAPHRLRPRCAPRAWAGAARERGTAVTQAPAKPRIRRTTGDVYSEPWTYKPREERVVGGDTITSDVTIKADVCVIGTGAGGAPVAKELAEGGMSVVTLEAGAHFTTDDFTARPREMTSLLYRDAGQTATFGNVPIILPLGESVAGSTLINLGTCFRTPDALLESWRERFGLDAYAPADLDPSFRRA